MHCLSLNGASSPCTSFKPHVNLACGLHVALATIAACGLILSIAALVAYLPPIAGYCGGAGFILSLTTLAISCIVDQRDQSIRQVSENLSDTDIQTSESGTKPVHRELVPQPTDVLSDEMYINIFRKLNGLDLARASRVCRRWNQVASDNRLWQLLCLQEVISPPEGQISSSYVYKDMYREAQILGHKIRTLTPKESQTPIFLSNNPNESDGLAFAFLKTKDRMFIYFNLNKQNYLVMRDNSISAYLSLAPIDEEIYQAQIKIIEDTVYLISTRWWWEEGSNNKRTDFYVYPFTIKENKLEARPKMHFGEEGSTIQYNRTQFEVGKSQAYVGQKDGLIIIWDLESEGKLFGQARNDPHFCYEGSDWDEYDEKAWRDSFGKKNLIKMLDASNRTFFWMEEGEYQRDSMSIRRERHALLQKQKKLVGHTQEITTLRSAGNFLFSSAEDGTIKQWDLSTCQCIKTIETGFAKGVSSLQTTGRYIFGLEKMYRKTIRQWDLVTLECLFQIDLKEPCVSFQVVGNLLFCCHGMMKTIEIFDLSTKARIKTLTDLSRSTNPHFAFANQCFYLLYPALLTTLDYSTH